MEMVIEVVGDEGDEEREIGGARARASVLRGIPFLFSVAYRMMEENMGVVSPKVL